MTILGIDGALGRFSAALLADGGTASEAAIDGRRALEAGLATIERVLRDASCRVPDRVAVGIGPGGFTGLRIALSYAKSLAQGWNVPLVAVSSFDALEYGLSLAPPVLTAVLGRQSVISARLRAPGRELRRASGNVSDVVSELDPLPRELTTVNATTDLLQILQERGVHVAPAQPAGTPAASIAAIAQSRTPANSYHELRADYGELPAAKVPTF